MAKKKSKSKKVNNGPKTVVARRERVPRPVPNNQLLESVCAVTDPFCVEARGAKWFGKGASNTMTLQTRQMLTVSTGAGGWGVLTFFPSNSIYQLHNQAVAGTTHQSTSLPTSDSVLANFQLNVEKLRVVSSGLRVYDVAPATATGGVIIATEFGSFAEMESKILNTTAVGEGAASCVADRRKPFAWVSRPSTTTTYDYKHLSTGGAGGSNDRTGVSICVSGAVSSPVVMVEIVTNYEIQLKALTGLGSIQSREPMSAVSPLTQGLSQLVDQNLPSFYEGAVALVSRSIKTLAREAFSTLMGSSGPRLLAGTAAMIVD